mmetsp:Transcript_16561/g.49147  ORF Transcript_16561/g.49147 Transcript_16561/m.49147 type:complete len:270 (-) Transcript_16561:54-863(-)
MREVMRGVALLLAVALRSDLREAKAVALHSDLREPKLWSWEEIQASDDCLVVIYNEVFNFSDTTTRSVQKNNRTFFEWHPGGEAVVTHWCGEDATNAFSAAGAPHHAGVVIEKGYGGLVVGGLDVRTHRSRGHARDEAPPAAAAEKPGWREDVGRQSWFHYHSVAALYPEEPSPEDEAAMQGLAASLRLYPCATCRNALLNGELDEVGPIPTATREAVSTWWCELHNVVNRDIGKTQFACDLATLDAAYLASCDACIADPAEASPAFAA